MGFKYPEPPPVLVEETENTNHIETNQSTEAEQVQEQ